MVKILYSQLEINNLYFMSTYLNMTVVGRLGTDLKNAKTKNDTDYVNLNIAHSIPVKNPDNTWGEKTVWVQATYWGTLGDAVEHFKKGTMVLCEGIPSAELYTPQGGSMPKATLVMTVYKRPLLLAKPVQSQPYAQHPAVGSSTVPQAQEPSSIPADDLPF